MTEPASDPAHTDLHGQRAEPPDRDRAAELLADADRYTDQVRAEGRSYSRFLAGLGSLTTLWFVFLAWLAGSDRGVLVSAAVFAGGVVALALGYLPRAGANRHGFARRFSTAMIAWSGAFAALLTIGMVGFRGLTAYWLVAALPAGLPALLGARREANA